MNNDDSESMDSISIEFYKPQMICEIQKLLNGLVELEWTSVSDKRDNDLLYEYIIHTRSYIKIINKYICKKYYCPITSSLSLIMETLVSACIIYEKNNVDTTYYEIIIDLLIDIEIEFAKYDN